MAKTKSRGNGDGSIFFNEQKNKWVAQISLGKDENGKLKRRTLYGKTRKEVKEKLDKTIAELQYGFYVEPSKITISEFIKVLVDEDKALNRIGADTYNRKIATYDRLKSSSIGCIPLQKITETDINRFLITIVDYSDSVISKDFQLLKRCFRDAINRNIISKNPMMNCKCPKSTQNKIKTRALTLTEHKALLEILNGTNKMYSYQMRLMLYTGMRMGEINALDVDDINFNFKTINIRRSLTRDDTEHTVIGKKTKTYAGKRTIPMSQATVDLLRDYLDNHYEPSYENLLFWNFKQNVPVATSQLNSQLRRLKEDYNFIEKIPDTKVSLHSLRHTYATRCIEAGMPPKVLQGLLGHTDIKITLNTYCDAFSEFRDDALDKVQKYLDKKQLIG